MKIIATNKIDSKLKIKHFQMPTAQYPKVMANIEKSLQTREN